MVKKMRNMTGRLVDFVTGKRFLTMRAWRWSRMPWPMRQRAQQACRGRRLYRQFNSR